MTKKLVDTKRRGERLKSESSRVKKNRKFVKNVVQIFHRTYYHGVVVFKRERQATEQVRLANQQECLFVVVSTENTCFLPLPLASTLHNLHSIHRRLRHKHTQPIRRGLREEFTTQSADRWSTRLERLQRPSSGRLRQQTNQGSGGQQTRNTR